MMDISKGIKFRIYFKKLAEKKKGFLRRFFSIEFDPWDPTIVYENVEYETVSVSKNGILYGLDDCLKFVYDGEEVYFYYNTIKSFIYVNTGQFKLTLNDNTSYNLYFKDFTPSIKESSSKLDSICKYIESKVNEKFINYNFLKEIGRRRKLLVGGDIAPGEYYLRNYGDRKGYYAVYEGENRMFDDYFTGGIYINVEANERLEFHDCVLYTLDKIPDKPRFNEKEYRFECNVKCRFLRENYYDNEYIVGRDIAPGEYYLRNYGDREAHFKIFNNNHDLISIKNFTGGQYIKINDGEILKYKFCILYNLDEKPEFDTDTPGMYKVGVDIPEGEYYIAGAKDNYCEILNNSLKKIIRNYNFSDGIYITVCDGEYLYFRKGKLYKFDSKPETHLIENRVYNGILKVGCDISPGEYLLKANGDYGYYAITENTRSYFSKIDDFFKGETEIFLTENDYLKISNIIIKKL